MPLLYMKSLLNDLLSSHDKQSIWREKQLHIFYRSGRPIFNIDEKNLPLQKAARSKNIGGRACTSYRDPYLEAFVEWLGNPFPKSANHKPKRCMYIDLMVRKAILEKKAGLVWWTPEEWSILNEESVRNQIRKSLK